MMDISKNTKSINMLSYDSLPNVSMKFSDDVLQGLNDFFKNDFKIQCDQCNSMYFDARELLNKLDIPNRNTPELGEEESSLEDAISNMIHALVEIWPQDLRQLEYTAWFHANEYREIYLKHIDFDCEPMYLKAKGIFVYSDEKCTCSAVIL